MKMSGITWLQSLLCHTCRWLCVILMQLLLKTIDLTWCCVANWTWNASQTFRVWTENSCLQLALALLFGICAQERKIKLGDSGSCFSKLTWLPTDLGIRISYDGALWACEGLFAFAFKFLAPCIVQSHLSIAQLMVYLAIWGVYIQCLMLLKCLQGPLNSSPQLSFAVPWYGGRKGERSSIRRWEPSYWRYWCSKENPTR